VQEGVEEKKTQVMVGVKKDHFKRIKGISSKGESRMFNK
jgi:hypothetical protein